MIVVDAAPLYQIATVAPVYKNLPAIPDLDVKDLVSAYMSCPVKRYYNDLVYLNGLLE